MDTNFKVIEMPLKPHAAPLVRMMTEAEARERVKQINNQIGEIGKLLLDMKEREGWKALGYSNWYECAAAEFKISQSRIYQLLDASKTQQEISTICGMAPTRESQLREFSDIETPEEKAAVYKAAIETAPNGKLTAKHIREERERIEAENQRAIEYEERFRVVPAKVAIPDGDPYLLVDDQDRIERICNQVNAVFDDVYPLIIHRLKKNILPCDYGLALKIIHEDPEVITVLDSIRAEYYEWENKSKKAHKEYNRQLRRAQ
jgi:hypothetical protein